MVATSVEVPLLHYEYAPAKRTRPPVVLLPGLFAGGWMWDKTWAALTERRFGVVVLLDALAAVDATSEGVGTLRAALKQLLDRLDLRRVSVCGNSFGALAALDFAAHEPQAVEALALSGTPGLSPEADAGIGVPRQVQRGHVVELARRMFRDPTCATPVMIDRTHALLSEPRHVRTVVRALRAARDYPIADALSRLSCRTLLVWGANDAITPAAPWKRAARTMRRCTFRLVPRCGHSPMIERPHEFNRILLEFLSLA
ncbi:MAG TPA: alpha/beta hydrolase [Gemmatimonadales bacterium]|jgi:pimeloyl-ACP methyl ester carboxylesterase|nr:alpha/beta hydrolase [Gemmatimonadales bacterium]